jgi:hypothetical protein
MSTVTANDMRDKLLTLDQYREKLAVDEPVECHAFSTNTSSGNTGRFHLGTDWAAGLKDKADSDPVEATFSIGRRDHQLTKGAIVTALSGVKIQGGLAATTPSALIEPVLNYWYENGPERGHERQLVAIGGTVRAITKPSIVPFSNMQIFDTVTAKLRQRFGSDLLVDYKSRHHIRNSVARIVVPDVVREGTAEVRDGDVWSVGIEAHNSLTGEFPTELNGYLFRWFCTNGCTTDHGSGKWNRRAHGQDPANVMEWARDSIDGILGGLEAEFDNIRTAANTPLNGTTNDVLQDAFGRYDIPLAPREDVIANMVDSDDLTLYGVQQAITAAANVDGRTAGDIDRLLRAGGQVSHDVERCDACHRAMS